jgi:hypothetical protein
MWIVQFQYHNITSDKLSEQNNERIYHVKQTAENRRPSKMGDVATLLFVHFNFIKQFIVCYDIDNVQEHIEVISIQKLINIDRRKLVEIVVLILKK